MKESQLRQIIREEFVNILEEDSKPPRMNTLRIGSGYLLRYKNNGVKEVSAIFKGKYKDAFGEDRLEFEGVGSLNGKFEVYKYNGVYCIGSGANRVTVVAEIEL